VAPSLDFSIIKVNLGMAMAAKVARIATTIINSINVNPFSFNGNKVVPNGKNF
jgi:hypothetical protein